MKITEEFCPADRYVYDFDVCSRQKGFAQIDTRQDAWYFGNWCNPFKRIIFSYVEGDCTTVECETDAEFVQKLREMEAWNNANEYGFKIDPLCDQAMIDRFKALGLGDLLH